MNELKALLVEAEQDPKKFFGEHELSKVLAKAHPDRHQDADKEQAEKIFKRFQELESSIKDLGTICGYEIIKTLGKGDVSDVYLGKLKDILYVLKVCNVKQANGLMKLEVENLKAIKDALAGGNLGDFYPTVLDVDDHNGMVVSVFPYNKNHISLLDLKSKFPDGIDDRHIVWLFKRVLTAIATSGFVHGNVLPTHILVDPTTHGINLIDWKAATKFHEEPIMISAAYRDWYPQEVLDKKSLGIETDLYMLAKCIRFIARKDLEPRIQTFLGALEFSSPAMRPSNTWQLYENFTTLAERLYGPPKWVDLIVH